MKSKYSVTRLLIFSACFFVIISTFCSLLSSAQEDSPLYEAIQYEDNRIRSTPIPGFADEEPPKRLTYRDTLFLFASYDDEYSFEKDVLLHLNSESESIRIGCMRILSLNKLTSCSPLIVDRVRAMAHEEPSLRCRSYAVSLIGTLNDERDIPFLLSLVCGEDIDLHHSASWTLVDSVEYLTEEDVETLISILDDNRTYQMAISLDYYNLRSVSLDVAKLLGKLGPQAETALPKLRELFRDEMDLMGKCEYAGAALRISPNTKWAARHLVDTLHFHRIDTVRMAAIYAMTGIQGERFSCVPHFEHAYRFDRDDFIKGVSAGELLRSYESPQKISDFVREALAPGSSEEVVSDVLSVIQWMDSPPENSAECVMEYLNRFFTEGSPFREENRQTDLGAVLAFFRIDSDERCAAFFANHLSNSSIQPDEVEALLCKAFEQYIPNREALRDAFLKEIDRCDPSARPRMVRIVEYMTPGCEAELLPNHVDAN